MKLLTKKNFIILLTLAALLFTGYARDFIFKSINALLKARDFGLDYELEGGLSIFQNWSTHDLVLLKWALTAIFTLLYFLIGALALRILFPARKGVRIFLIAYGAVTISALLVIMTGILVTAWNMQCYTISRFLMELVQSPLVLMIVIPALKLSDKENPLLKTKS